MIFSLDESEVKKADIIFMNLDGRVPDEGACVELGMDLNPMISGCMIKIFKDFNGDKMIEQLRAYLSEN